MKRWDGVPLIVSSFRPGHNKHRHQPPPLLGLGVEAGSEIANCLLPLGQQTVPLGQQ